MSGEHAASRGPGPPPSYGGGGGPQGIPARPANGLTVCVDDFGLHAGVNAAAIELASRRRVTAVTCLPDGPAWQDGLPALRRLDAGTQVGLHLNFSEPFTGTALARPLPRLVIDALARRLDRKAVRAEIRRQHEAFVAGLGREPDFVDGHQHVHQLPGIRDALIDVLDERAGARRPWIRRSMPVRVPRAGRSGFAEGAKAWAIRRLGADALGRLAAARGYAQNARLLGVYGFDGSESDYLARLRSWLAVARPGDLLMCHPSVPGDWRDPLLPARIREYRVLSGPGFAELLQRTAVAIA